MGLCPGFYSVCQKLLGRCLTKGAINCLSECERTKIHASFVTPQIYSPSYITPILVTNFLITPFCKSSQNPQKSHKTRFVMFPLKSNLPTCTCNFQLVTPSYDPQIDHKMSHKLRGHYALRTKH